MPQEFPKAQCQPLSSQSHPAVRVQSKIAALVIAPWHVRIDLTGREPAPLIVTLAQIAILARAGILRAAILAGRILVLAGSGTQRTGRIGGALAEQVAKNAATLENVGVGTRRKVTAVAAERAAAGIALLGIEISFIVAKT